MKRMLVFLLLAISLTSILVACNEATPSDGPRVVDYPKKTIELYAPVKPGGGTDASARIFAEGLSKEIGKPVIVVNIDGGGGSIANEEVRNANPDGYKLLYTHTMLQTSYYSGNYDYRYIDFKPITTTTGSYQTIAVTYDAPFNDLDEFVKAAKEKPGEYKFAVQFGGSSHFLAGAVMEATGTDFQLVDGGTESERVLSLQEGSIDLSMIGATNIAQYLEAKKLKPLAVPAEERDPLHPDFPTAKEQGYEIVSKGMHVLYGPKDLPGEIAEVLSKAAENMSKSEDFIKKMEESAGVIYEYRSIEDTLDFLQREDSRIEATAIRLGLTR